MDLLREMSLLWLSLLTLFNPPSAVAAFAPLMTSYPPEVQRRMARRAAVIYLLVMLLVTWAGRPILWLLGLSVPALKVAGGSVLLLAALPMVTQYQRQEAREQQELKAEAAKSPAWHQVVAVPMTFPISLGGATVAAVMAATGSKIMLARAMSTSLVCLLMTAVVWSTLRSAAPLARRISRGSMAALTTVSGLLLLCIAFQVIAAGLRELLPGLN